MLAEGLQAVTGFLSNSGGAHAILSGSMANHLPPSTNSTVVPPLPSSLPTSLGDVIPLLSLLLSFGALRDWLKLFLMGGLLESVRRCVNYLYSAFVESFLLTVEIDSEDPAYQWMLLWLSRHHRWTKARELELLSMENPRRHKRRRYDYESVEDDDQTVMMAPLIGEPVGGLVRIRDLMLTSRLKAPPRRCIINNDS
jgi:hypothetical protein